MAKTAKPSPSTKKPAPGKLGGKREGAGRKKGSGAFQPTPEQSNMVRTGSALGIPEDRLVNAIINPATNKPISPKTLRRYFRTELDRGLLEADLTAGANLLKLTGHSAAAAIFWAKVRLHWKETAAIKVPGVPAGSEDPEVENVRDVARRIAFLLVMGGRVDTPGKAKKK